MPSCVCWNCSCWSGRSYCRFFCAWLGWWWMGLCASWHKDGYNESPIERINHLSCWIIWELSKALFKLFEDGFINDWSHPRVVDTGWRKKSQTNHQGCITDPINNWIFTISTGAGFFLQHHSFTKKLLRLHALQDGLARCCWAVGRGSSTMEVC